MKEIYNNNKEQCQSIIKRVPFFSSFKNDALGQIAAEYNHFFVFDEGEKIIHENKIEHCFYVLLSGMLNVVKKGLPWPLATLQPGEIFGEIGFLSARSN